jgi:hypothetical protein
MGTSPSLNTFLSDTSLSTSLYSYSLSLFFNRAPTSGSAISFVFDLILRNLHIYRKMPRLIITFPSVKLCVMLFYPFGGAPLPLILNFDYSLVT